MRRPTGSGRGLRLRVGHGRGSRALPAVHRAGVHRRDDRPVAAVAEGAADRGRPAADQQRRRHHQLRDAADRASRCTPSTSTACPAARSSSARPRDGEKMTTLDGVERTFDAEIGAGLRPRGALGHRRDHGRPGLGGLRLHHPRAARGRDLERGRTSCGPRASWGCARRPPTGSRSSFIRSLRCARSGSPRKLMVELCGARLVPGTIDVAADPPPPRGSRCGRGALERAARACAIEPRGLRQLPRAARLRRRAPTARRRRPRSRRTATTTSRREADLIEEVGPHPRLRRAPARARCRRRRPAAAA